MNFECLVYFMFMLGNGGRQAGFITSSRLEAALQRLYGGTAERFLNKNRRLFLKDYNNACILQAHF